MLEIVLFAIQSWLWHETGAATYFQQKWWRRAAVATTTASIVATALLDPQRWGWPVFVALSTGLSAYSYWRGWRPATLEEAKRWGVVLQRYYEAAAPRVVADDTTGTTYEFPVPTNPLSLARVVFRATGDRYFLLPVTPASGPTTWYSIAKGKIPARQARERMAKVMEDTYDDRNS